MHVANFGECERAHCKALSQRRDIVVMPKSEVGEEDEGRLRGEGKIRENGWQGDCKAKKKSPESYTEVGKRGGQKMTRTVGNGLDPRGLQDQLQELNCLRKTHQSQGEANDNVWSFNGDTGKATLHLAKISETNVDVGMMMVDVDREVDEKCEKMEAAERWSSRRRRRWRKKHRDVAEVHDKVEGEMNVALREWRLVVCATAPSPSLATLSWRARPRAGRRAGEPAGEPPPGCPNPEKERAKKGGARKVGIRRVPRRVAPRSVRAQNFATDTRTPTHHRPTQTPTHGMVNSIVKKFVPCLWEGHKEYKWLLGGHSHARQGQFCG